MEITCKSAAFELVAGSCGSAWDFTLPTSLKFENERKCFALSKIALASWQNLHFWQVSANSRARWFSLSHFRLFFADATVDAISPDD